MRNNLPRMHYLIAFLFITSAAYGQDTRSVTEPSFPPVCSLLDAQLVKSGPAGIPLSSEKAFDTARIQSALELCAQGQAVELRPSGSNNAFLIAPIRLPAGVTLLVDAGVTVFASRNPRDYDANSSKMCGTISTDGSGCLPLIAASGSDGAGIMGFGVIDGRGHLPMLVNGGASNITWWDLANQANTQGLNQNNPRLIQINNTNGFTLYKIMLMNVAKFHVALGTCTNFTRGELRSLRPTTRAIPMELIPVTPVT